MANTETILDEIGTTIVKLMNLIQNTNPNPNNDQLINQALKLAKAYGYVEGNITSDGSNNPPAP